MKNEAISRRELPRLIRRILHGETWSATRGGRRCSLHRDASLFDSIAYAVCIDRHWYRGSAPTVADAVDRINAMCKRPRKKENLIA